MAAAGAILRSTGWLLPLASVVALAGCGPTETTGTAGNASDPELVFVRGYRSVQDSCQLTGENAFTSDFLDDAADLVSCPTGSADDASLRSETGARQVAQTASHTLYSVPRR